MEVIRSTGFIEHRMSHAGRKNQGKKMVAELSYISGVPSKTNQKNVENDIPYVGCDEHRNARASKVHCCFFLTQLSTSHETPRVHHFPRVAFWMLIILLFMLLACNEERGTC